MEEPAREGPAPAPLPPSGFRRGVDAALMVALAVAFLAMTSGWVLRKYRRGAPAFPPELDADSIGRDATIASLFGLGSILLLVALLRRPRGICQGRASSRALLAAGLGGLLVSSVLAALGQLASGERGGLPSLPAIVGYDVGLLVAAAMCWEVAGRPGTRGRWRATGVGLLAWLLSLPLAALAGVLNSIALAALGYGGAEPQAAIVALQETPGSWSRLAYTVSFVAVAPVGEEWIFRGTLYPALRASGGVVPAAIASGLFFGAIHMTPGYTLPLTILGIVLALVYERTGTLVAPMALHAAQNGFGVAVALLPGTGPA